MHPLSLAAILLLLVNDHLLKQADPSWLTGKVSDIAGLFFFPFLLALVLALGASPLRHIRSEALGAVAFFASAISFAAAKGSAVGNGMMVDLVSILLDRPVSIMYDPTDLIALLSLWPAWRLWQSRQRYQEKPKLERHVAFPAILLASLATIATPASNIYRESGITDLVIHDGRLYAVHGSTGRAFTTTDNGESWSQVERSQIQFEMPDSLNARSNRIAGELVSLGERYEDLLHRLSSVSGESLALEKSRRPVPLPMQELEKKLADSVTSLELLRDSLEDASRYLSSLLKLAGPPYVLPGESDPILLQDPRRPGVLYRTLPESTRIERSEDGGKSWSVDWEISEARYDYIDRHALDDHMVISYGVTDMIFTPDRSGTLVVSLGGEGILVRDPDGEWRERPIDGLVPITSSARNISDIGSSLTLEWFAFIALGIIAGIVINSIGWHAMPRIDEQLEERRPRTLLRFSWLAAVLVIGGPFGIGIGEILGLLVPIICFLPASLLFAVVIISDWSGMKSFAARERSLSKIIVACRRGSAAAFLLPMLCMICWTLGVPASYTVAAVIAGLSWIGSIIWATIAIRRSVRSSPRLIAMR
jgi:hypothetical protein